VVASKLARFSWLPGGLATVIVIVIGKIFAATSFTPAEFAVYDRAQRASRTAPAADIVILDIDAASLDELGEWPWPRNIHAGLIDRLHSSGARVIAFTAPFGAAEGDSEMDRVRDALRRLESSNPDKSAQAQQLRELLTSSNGLDPTAQLAQAIAAHGKVVLPITLRTGAASDQPPALSKQLLMVTDPIVLDAAQEASDSTVPQPLLMKTAGAVGHLHLPLDRDNVVRSDLAGIRAGDALIPSLALAVASLAIDTTPSTLTFDGPDSLRLGEMEIALDKQLRIRPQYFAAKSDNSFTHYSYRQVFAGEVPAEQLRDKIVLIGHSDSSIATSADRQSTTVAAIASTVSSLIDGNVYSRPAMSRLIEWVLAVLVVLFCAFALPAVGLTFGAVSAVLLIVVMMSTEIGLLGSAHIWTQLMLPCLAVLVGFGAYAVGETLRRANAKGGAGKDPSAQLRVLGQTFQKQGQLDLAFETYQRCPLDAPTMELLYYLGTDFERRRQNQKAAAVYNYIAMRDPNYRDLRMRRSRVKEDPVARETTPLEKPPVLRQPVASPPPMRRSAPAPEEEAPRPARTLGRYEIERELGKGAMGVVYLGRDPKINRVVAIKAIPLAQEFGEEDLVEARARFFREAEMAGRLNHPAIVTVYDAGEDNGLAYIAMEYLRGQHLSYFTDSARLLPPEKVMLLAARTAEALHYAHRQNVVHRDIKPANIMYNSEADELKITDFGIARLTDTSRTKTGIVLGTPSFMSPEQLEGRNLDGRSDQFALGVSLYQLLCAQLPFRGDSMPRLMQKIATEPHAPIRTVRPELPPQIDAIIDRVLEKNADDRFANCAELAAALRACVKGIEGDKPARSEHEWLLP
jgi:CHASE2 domain-containing sensor protein/predicted Ser/Thr protein kinase